MRIPRKTELLFVGTVALGAATAAAAAAHSLDASLTLLALLGAAALVTELIQVPSEELSLDSRGSHPFSFSSTIHLAAALLAGPWVAALVAIFGVAVVDPLRGAPWRQVTFNASVFAVSAAAGGLVFDALATPGDFGMPGDLDALAAAAFTYYALDTVFVAAIIAFSSGAPLASLARETFVGGLPSLLGEAALPYALAHGALTEPWGIVALVPLVLAVYHAHARLAMLKRETARALETFANVVDERDPSTFRHSERVAGHVERLAQRLGLPVSDVLRLRWAGRLHDLGKLAVDPGILHKAGPLTAAEWDSVRRHPRLSARLLRRFRFAANEALAVEYHHERYDGLGYYGVGSEHIPLAAHFLVIADSYDAMVSDRPYRRGMPRELALTEIEAQAGKQFHPLVARAFVAMERGVDPASVLAPEELAELRAAARVRANPAAVVRALGERRELVALAALAAALTAIGFGSRWVAAGALGAALVVVATERFERARAGRLAAALEGIVARPEARLADVASALSVAAPLVWAGIVRWQESGATGFVGATWGEPEAAPSEAALASWLLRDLEDQRAVTEASSFELGIPHPALGVALPDESGAHAHLVLVFRSLPSRRVKLALGSLGASLGRLLPECAPAPSRPSGLLAVA